MTTKMVVTFGVLTGRRGEFVRLLEEKKRKGLLPPPPLLLLEALLPPPLLLLPSAWPDSNLARPFATAPGRERKVIYDYASLCRNVVD